MGRLDDIDGWLEQRLPALIAEHDVPGAGIAVAIGDELVEHAAGVLNTATGVETTIDSLFQIGSVTKLWTATLVQQLVDSDGLNLDAPVREYLPAFRVADERAASTITIRQLLCHTSGFEGDQFTDTGRGDDCLARYVDTLGESRQLFPPGEMFSYNNAGYCVLGRLVEVLRDKPYTRCLQDHLIGPLGLEHTASSVDEAILHRTAVGHVQPAPGVDPEPAPRWALAASNAPAGSMLSMCPRDLLRFARMHLQGGTAVDGTRVLSAAGVRAMRERQVELPYLGILGNAWGLGWEIFDWPGTVVLGHDGGTIGQSAFLRIVPASDVAIALLTNGGTPIKVYMEIFRRALSELAGVQPPPFQTPFETAGPIDGDRCTGRYGSDVLDTEITQDGDGRVWALRTPKGAFAEAGRQPETIELVPLHDDMLVSAEPQRGLHAPFVFLGDDGHGRAAFVHTGRADPRWS